MNARVHSFESMGTVDGPGLRFVVFLQGCPLRCLYCHNPDTWEVGIGKEYDSDFILNEFNKNKGFYESGGITVTGGEPLLQIDFLTELFQKAKKQKIHTCIDTSGIVFNPTSSKFMEKINKLLDYTDLILLDIKEIDPIKHKKLTGFDNMNILDFARYLSDRMITIWVRHVVIPGLTDDEQGWFNLGYFLGELKNIKALDILPYHTMGATKYKQLNMIYPLDGVPEASKEIAVKARTTILQGIKARRLSLIKK